MVSGRALPCAVAGRVWAAEGMPPRVALEQFTDDQLRKAFYDVYPKDSLQWEERARDNCRRRERKCFSREVWARTSSQPLLRFLSAVEADKSGEEMEAGKSGDEVLTTDDPKINACELSLLIKRKSRSAPARRVEWNNTGFGRTCHTHFFVKPRGMNKRYGTSRRRATWSETIATQIGWCSSPHSSRSTRSHTQVVQCSQGARRHACSGGGRLAEYHRVCT